MFDCQTEIPFADFVAVRGLLNNIFLCNRCLIFTLCRGRLRFIPSLRRGWRLCPSNLKVRCVPSFAHQISLTQPPCQIQACTVFLRSIWQRLSGFPALPTSTFTQLMGLGKPVISAPKKGTGKKSAGQLSSSPGPVKMRLSLSGIRGRFPHRAVHLHTKVAEVVYQGGFAYGSSLYCFLVPRTLVSR
jgi:hypothetical protein